MGDAHAAATEALQRIARTGGAERGFAGMEGFDVSDIGAHPAIGHRPVVQGDGFLSAVAGELEQEGSGLSPAIKPNHHPNR